MRPRQKENSGLYDLGRVVKAAQKLLELISNFLRIRQPRLLLLLHDWDARPSQVKPGFVSTVPILYTWVEKDNVELSSFSQENCSSTKANKY